MQYQKRIIEAIFDSKSKESTVASSQKAAIEVYQNNYIETGIRALSIGFSTLHALMHESDFRRLSTEYLTHYPKTCFDWADYGEHLPDFILQIEALAEQPFLSEIAELDWRLLHIERSADKAFNPSSFALLQSTDPSQLRFTPAPGLQIMQAIFPLDALYQNAHSDELNDAQAQINTNKLLNDAIISAQYRSIVLWREQYKALFEYCEPIACKAFESMLNNDTVAQVLGHFEDDQHAMTDWLQSHIATKKIYAVIEH